MKNILTIDVEDFYQGTEFDHRPQWASYAKQSTVEKNTRELLELLEEYGETATFFVLDDIAARFPDLVREIGERGHEVAAHGVSHLPLDRIGREEFAEEIARNSGRLAEITGERPIGYRAPFFTMKRRMDWARDILLQHGFKYDSSIFPIYNYLGGDPGAPRFPFDWGGLWEVPISTFSCFGFKTPFSGGFYFRCLPFWWVRSRISSLNRKDRPVVFYLHPREIDPEQPRLKMTRKQELFYYVNLKSMEKKLHRLFKEFDFQSIREFFDLG